MEIKRRFAYLTGARKFQIVINDRDAGEIKVFSKVQVEQPKSEFTIYFTAMKFERSKKYKIVSNKEIRIVVNINPYYRIISWLTYIMLFFVVGFRNVFDYSMLLVFFVIVSSLIVPYLIFVKRYISFKAYDMNNKRIPMEPISFSN